MHWLRNYYLKLHLKPQVLVGQITTDADRFNEWAVVLTRLSMCPFWLMFSHLLRHEQKHRAVGDPEVESVAAPLLCQGYIFFGFHWGRRSRGFCAAPSLASAAQAGSGDEGSSSSASTSWCPFLGWSAEPLSSAGRRWWRGAGRCESLEEDLVLDAPAPVLSLWLAVLSSRVLTDGISLRVSNLRRGIIALEEWRAGCPNRERLEG